MSQVDLACRLLCASAAAYCIKTTDKSGQYNPCGCDCSKPKGLSDTCKQYCAIGFVEDPYVITSLQIEACLVGKTATEVIVAFRGTLPPAKTWDSFFDWLQDFFAKPTTNINLPGEVHSGFLFALLSIADDIRDAINKLDPTHSLPLYVTGHSKGGGMAPIAAMYFKNAFKLDVAQTITFAGPKPGNKEFCDVYNTEFPNDIRYENYLDVVPLLPPSASFIGDLEKLPLPDFIKNLLKDAEGWDYETVGTLRYIDSDGKVSSPPLMSVRVLEIIGKLVTGDISAIADAHHASCGYRYMEGTCTGSVCGVSS